MFSSKNVAYLNQDDFVKLFVNYFLDLIVTCGRRRACEGKFSVSNNFVDANRKNQLVVALMKTPT